MTYCSKCGTEINDGAKFCPKCGTNVEVISREASPKEGRKKTKWFVLFAILAVLVIGGWFVWDNQKEDYSLEGLAKVVTNYDYIENFYDGMARVVKGDKCGFIDKMGNEIVPCIYEEVNPFSEGLAVVKKDVYYGFIDKSGREITDLIYSEAAEFKEGLACIEKGGKKGYIDNSGKEILSPIYDYALGFSEGVAAVCKNDKWGFVDKVGKEIIPLNYEAAGSFADGFAPVKKDGKWGYIDTSGKIVIPFQYGMADSFIDGYAQVYTENNCLIDKTGKIIADGFNTINLCQGGVAIVGKNAQFGLINNKGEELIPCKYRIIRSVSEGLFLVYDDKENLMIDRTGKTICKYEYDESYGDQYTLSEGLLAVSKNGKYGFVDMTGKVIIPCVYDEAHSFSGGLAVVKKDGVFGYVDKNGNSTFDFQKNEVNSEEAVKKRLNEIVEFAMKNSEYEDPVIEKYFSNEFRDLYKRMIECCNKESDWEGLWYGGNFWSGSSEDIPITMTAGNVNEINENKAVVDLIMGTDNGLKRIESVSLVFEKGNWFIDDIRGHKKELKEEIETCENYVRIDNEYEEDSNSNQNVDISPILYECQEEITSIQREIESTCRTFAVLASDDDIDMFKYSQMKSTFTNGVDDLVRQADRAFDRCAKKLQEAGYPEAVSKVNEEKRQFNGAIYSLKMRTLQQVDMSY